MMSKDERLDMLLKCLCESNNVSMAFGELYQVAFGEAPPEELLARLKEQDLTKEYMKSKRLIDNIPGEFPDVWFKVSQFGWEVHESGGWIKHINQIDQAKATAQQKEIDEQKLVRSTIEANELSKRNETFNKRFAIINFILGLLNIAILVWQMIRN